MKQDEESLWAAVVAGEVPRDAGARLGIAPKRVIRLCEKWANRGTYDYGVAADLGWVVNKPKALADTTPPRAGLVFEHWLHTTGYHRADGPEPVTYEITEVTEDGKVFYGPAQRGTATTASYWIWARDFHLDALGTYVGDRGAGA